jgi:hypothetical protein
MENTDASLRERLRFDHPDDSTELNEMRTKVLCVIAAGAVAVEPITLKLWPEGPPTTMVPKSDATVNFSLDIRDALPACNQVELRGRPGAYMGYCLR